MDGTIFWQALALMLVIEGLLPLVSPKGWRRVFEQILTLGNGQIRFFGLCSIGMGLILLVILA